MKANRLEQLIGPRPSQRELAAGRLQFLFPTLCLGVAGLLMIVSIFFPYWHLEVRAPSHSDGLRVLAYLNHLEGDVAQVDALNPQLGLRPLGEAAKLGRSLSVAAVVVIALLVISAIYIHNQYAALLSLPAVLFPTIFLLDLYSWLHHFEGQYAADPLSFAREPFAPPIFGLAQTGEFSTVTSAGAGLLLATTASLLILTGLYLHRRVYRPLVEARQP